MTSLTDEPLKRVEFKDMDIAAAEQFVAALRDRRMRVQREYEEKQRLRAEAAKAKLLEQLDTRLSQMHKAMVAADKAIAKAESYITKVRAIQMQFE